MNDRIRRGNEPATTGQPAGAGINAIEEMRAWAADSDWKDVTHYSELEDREQWPDTAVLDGIEQHYLATYGPEDGVAGFLNDLYYEAADGDGS